jgi:hypothetical protein
MYNIFVQYSLEETSIGVENVENTNLLLPVVSICSDVPYKRKVNTMDEEEYLNATFGYEELFPNAGKAWTELTTFCHVFLLPVPTRHFFSLACRQIVGQPYYCCHDYQKTSESTVEACIFFVAFLLFSGHFVRYPLF